MRLIKNSKERLAEAKRLASRYAKGYSLREIAAETGYSYGKVQRLVTEGGGQTRASGPRPRKEAS